MTSRERVDRSIRLGQPDRVPLIPCVQKSAWLTHGAGLEATLNEFSLDCPPIRRPPAEKIRAGQGQVWRDDWGCVWKREHAGEFGTVIEHSLEDWDAREDYVFPAPAVCRAPGRHDAGDLYRIGRGSEYGVLWYRLQFLRSFENIMVDLLSHPDRVRWLMDRVMEKRSADLGEVVKGDWDAIHFGDCWGTQSALMIHPDQWRDFFGPAYQRLFDIVHEAGKIVIFQSDGYTLDIVDDLVAMGADVLRPSLGMIDLEALSAKIRGKACLWSDPCRQHVLPRGTPAEVKEHIRRILEAFMTPEGGVIGGLYIYDDVPLANVRAALEAYLEYGQSGRNA